MDFKMLVPLRWMVGASLVLAMLSSTVPSTASAATVMVDEILFPDDVTNPGVLFGSVDMSLTGNVLTITLKNTSTGITTGDEASNLLTGIAFQLPTGILIDTTTPGSVVIAPGSSSVNPAFSAGTDVSREYGYDNAPLHAGPFKNDAFLTYTTSVGALEAVAKDAKFDPTLPSLADPDVLDGPEFGLLSALVPNNSAGGGNTAIIDTVIITLNLTGSVPTDLVSRINVGNVGLSFGSPNTSSREERGPLPSVPEPSSLAAWLLGSAGLGLILRRRLSKAVA